MKNTSDVIVIGAGVIGLMTTRELVAAGLTVTILDQGPAGLEASHAAGGILSPLHPWNTPAAVNTLAAWGQERYPGLVRELNEFTGIDSEWLRSGMLVLGGEDRKEALQWARRNEVKAVALSERAIRTQEPAVARGCGPGVWLQHVAQVRNVALLEALVSSLDGSGVLLLENTAAARLKLDKGRVAGVETAAGTLDAGLVVLAAGAWSGEFMSASGHPLPVRPVLGQMISYRDRPGVVKRILVQGEHYVIPRRDGVYVVGSTLENRGFGKKLTKAAAARLSRAAGRIVPRLADRKPERHWCGLRPLIPGELPAIGRHPDVEGLYLNTGHYCDGIVTAPASARLVTDLLVGQVPPFDPQPYALHGDD